MKRRAQASCRRHSRDRLAGPAIAQTGTPVRWRLATSWPKSLDTLHGTVEAMSQRVGELTDKKFDIQVFAGGEIVPPLQVWDATQTGTVECGHTLTAFYIGKTRHLHSIPAWRRAQHPPAAGLDVFAAGFRAQHAKKDGILAHPLRQCGRADGRLLPQGDQLGRRPQGLKFRIGGLGGMILSKLGVVPQQIPTADIYLSLERGTIDAAEWIGPMTMRSSGL